MWSYKAGEWGATVTVFERTPGGKLHARWWSNGRNQVVTLGHRSQSRAKRWAHQKADELNEGVDDSHATLERIFRLYQQNRSTKKSDTEEKADERRIELFGTYFGHNRRVGSPGDGISLREWEAFVDDRRSGRIDGRAREAEGGRPVSDRTVEADLRWFVSVLNWAVRWRVKGHYLLSENPVRGFPIPKERNPHRPVASEERFERLLEVSEQVMMELRRTGRRTQARSYLKEILILANDTARRISAICKLEWKDVLFDVPPSGAIRWPRDTDKEGKDRISPLTERAREALLVLREEWPDSRYVFSAPGLRDQPLHRNRADHWLRKAEALAGLERMGWHAFRRKWASERMGVPGAAQAGGWENDRTMQASYQHPDWELLVDAVNNSKPWTGRPDDR